MGQVVFREWTWQPAMNPKFLIWNQCLDDRSVLKWYEQELRAVLPEDRANSKSIPSGPLRLSKILPTKLMLSGSQGYSVFVDGPDFLESFDPCGRWKNRNSFSALSQTSSWEENNQFRIWRDCSNAVSSGMIEVIALNDESFPNLWNKCSSLTSPWRQALPSNISAVWFNSFFIGTVSKLFYRNRTGRLPGNSRENLPAGGRHPPL